MSRRRASQSQRVLEDEGSDGGSDVVGGVKSTDDAHWTNLSEAAQERYANALVRFMLCRHAVKAPVKRAELSKALFGDNPIRSKNSIYKGALKLAQQHLANFFACEMVEVVKQTKALRRATASATPAVAYATQVARDGTQSFGTGARGYILVSTLPAAARPLSKDEWALRAFLSIIAAIILLEPGCRIQEQDLFTALKTAGGIHVSENGHKQLNGGNVEELLTKTFLNQWYLERERDDARGPYYYYMGPRLRAELSDSDLLEFVQAVFNLDASDSQGDFDATTRKELQERLDAARGLALGADTDSS